MNIYLLKRPDTAVGYDEVGEVVVIAETPKRARSLFAHGKGPDNGPGDERAAVWLDVTQSSCTRLGVADRAVARVVVRHFYAA